MKKLLALLLVIIMVVGIATGCTGDDSGTSGGTTGTTDDTNAGTTDDAGSDTSTTGDADDGIVEITVQTVVDYATWNTEYWASEIGQAVLDATGVKLVMVFNDMEKFQILLATGDLPDVINFDSAPPNYESILIENGYVYELTELFEEHGQNYLNLKPSSVEFSKKFWSNGTGGFYFIPARSNGPFYVGAVEDFGLQLRWDIYKDIGYPDIDGLDGLLDVLKQMVDHYPETEDGRKTYAVTTFTDWGMQWQFSGLSKSWSGGLYDVPGWFCYFENKQGQPLRYANHLIEEDSPYWQQVEFFFKANQLGLFDTDGLVQTWDQMHEKVAAGSIMLLESAWNSWAFDAPNYDDAKGYMNLPLEGMGTLSRTKGHSLQGEICLPEQRVGITTNCQNPEKMVQLINFISSDEGGRLIHSGIQGRHWDYIDGIPLILPEIIERKTENAEELQKEVGFRGHMISFGPITGHTTMNDGGFADLWFSDEILAQGLSPLQIEYCNFFNVSYPTEIVRIMLDEGRMINIWPKLDEMAYAVFNPIIPDDLLIVEQRVMGQAQTVFSEAILASSPSEFAALKAAAIEDFNSSGINDVFAVYEKAWFDALDAVKDLR